MKTILILTDFNVFSDFGGGITSANRNLIISLKNNFKFINIFFKPCKVLEQENDIPNIYLKYSPFYPQNLIKTINHLKPDYIIINGLFSIKSSIIPIILNYFLKYKIIISPRGMLKESALKKNYLIKIFFLRILKYLLNNNTIFHATNNIEKDEINFFFKNSSTVVVSDTPPTLKTPYQKILKSENVLRLFYLARIDDIKNLLFLLNTIKLLREQNDKKYDLVLNIGGEIVDEKYWTKCKRLIDDLNNFQQININYLGQLNRIQIQKFFFKSHLFFLPTKGENFGYSIIESLSYSVPVLISNNTPFVNLEKLRFGNDLDLNDKHKFVEILMNYITMNDSIFSRIRRSIYENYNKFACLEKIKLDYIKIFNNKFK